MGNPCGAGRRVRYRHSALLQHYIQPVGKPIQATARDNEAVPWPEGCWLDIGSLQSVSVLRLVTEPMSPHEGIAISLPILRSFSFIADSSGAASQDQLS